jgi:hypothetical protein
MTSSNGVPDSTSSDPPAGPASSACSPFIQIDRGKRYFVQNRTPRRIRITVCPSTALSSGDDASGRSNGQQDGGRVGQQVAHQLRPSAATANGSSEAEKYVLELSPLGARVVCGERLLPFARQLRVPMQHHQLRVYEYDDDDVTHAVRRWFALLPARLVLPAVLICLAVGVHALVADGSLQRPLLVWSVTTTAALVLVMLIVSSVSEVTRRKRSVRSDMEEGDVDFGVGGSFYDGNETLGHTKHLLALAAVVVVGVVLPTITIFLATDAKDFIVIDGGLAVVQGRESRLVGRVIQVTYTSLLSIFPALLYFQFDLHRVGTIRAQWVRAIFRLNPQMQTLADVNARYGDDLSEASSYSTDSARFLGGRNSPIVIATILVALGWTLLVAPTASFDFAAAADARVLAQAAELAEQRARTASDLAEAEAARADADDALAEASDVLEQSTGDTATTASTTVPAGPPTMDETAAATSDVADQVAAVEAQLNPPFFELLDPTPSAAAMAFLGAYFFGIYLLLRSYFRGDLRPKMYNQITARLVTVVVLAYLINALFFEQLDAPNHRMVWALSFLAGVVPTTVLQKTGRLLSETFGAFARDRGGLGDVFEKTFATPRSLTQVDGIDIHDSTRLETEGITDIPSLAKGDLVSMMVKTRLPVERLIDWMDQALLIVHVDGPGDDLDPRVQRLRHAGIRTASMVIAAADGKVGGRAGRTLVDRALALDEEDEAEPTPANEPHLGWWRPLAKARQRGKAEGTAQGRKEGRAEAEADATARAAAQAHALATQATTGDSGQAPADGQPAPTHGATPVDPRTTPEAAPNGQLNLATLADLLRLEPAMEPIRSWRSSGHLDVPILIPDPRELASSTGPMMEVTARV